MAKGVFLLQKVSTGTRLLDYIPGQGIGIDFDPPDKALGHSDAFVSQHQLGRGADHAVVHISDVMDQIESGQPLGQDGKGRFDTCLSVQDFRIGCSPRRIPG